MAFVMSHTLNLQHSESDGQTNDEQRKKKAGGFYFRIRVCIRITYFDCILKKKVDFSFESRLHKLILQAVDRKYFDQYQLGR